MSTDSECKALVISCIDYRFVTKVRNYLSNQNLKESYDLITTPGASLNIDKVSDHIGISFRLHKPKEVYIIDHEDCGAYGADNSKERHELNLKKARQALEKSHPEAKVHTSIAYFKKIVETN